MKEHEYSFDVKFFTVFTVKAVNPEAAEKLLNERLNFASIAFDGEANKDGRVSAGGLDPDGEFDLTEIDGEMA